MKKHQVDRMNKINELIEVIANTDNKTSKFLEGNKLFFIDKYTEKKVYPYPTSKHWGFSEGGTLWGLVNDFREWIITGKVSNGNNGYGGLYCTCWGYSIDGMDKVITKAEEIGFLPQNKPSFRERCLFLKDTGNEWLLGQRIKNELINTND